jgi:hypothetical protein
MGEAIDGLRSQGRMMTDQMYVMQMMNVGDQRRMSQFRSERPRSSCMLEYRAVQM